MPKHTKPMSRLAVGDVKQVLFDRRYTEDHPDFVSWDQWITEYWAREAARSGLVFEAEPYVEHAQSVVTKARVTGVQ